ncbi:MAG: ATP-grasp domain-containing protein, partial [Lentisphaeria bacterium]|nr:ATP-grasp domain-containing protein [Lentisphaeria bacterium]
LGIMEYLLLQELTIMYYNHYLFVEYINPYLIHLNFYYQPKPLQQNQLQQYMHAAVQASAERPVLIDSYLEAAVEVDVDCISDGNLTVVGAIMEHVEEAGVHSGDSACVIPAPTLGAAVKDRIREYSQALAKELNVIGLMNIQYAVQDNEVYILEVNPRASRTIPFVSKAIGIPLAKYASLIMVGKTLPELGFTAEVTPPQVSVKEAVFPFIRFPGTDITLSPEMKSTGEVMGIDVSTGLAYLKSQLAAGSKLPRTGNIFLSVRDDDKESVLDGARRLQSMGFTIYATAGTGAYLRAQGVASVELEKISDGSPNVLDLVADRNLAWIVNTPASGVAPRVDEIRMRGESVIHGIPITTTVAGFLAAVSGLEALKGAERMDVRTIQEYHADLNG